jgi:DNA-binding transcriptional MerR regulator
MEVESISIGEAAERLGVPVTTLRGWTDKLEELQIHKLNTNHRDERVFNDDDMEIFAFMRDVKKQFGPRRATTIDIAYMIEERFKEKIRMDGPPVDPNKRRVTAVTEIDAQHLMQNERFMELLNENLNQLKDKLREEIKAELVDEIASTVEKRVGERLNDIEERRIQKMDEWITEQRALHTEQRQMHEQQVALQKRGILKKLFGME